ncbi:hypothetical protein, partial [Chromobacterium sp. ASV23]|uniref:hypothetical protein n=1 Tax=Chromobacterium sp. ASV23 TaxID=2795110 RepID=UPI0018EE17C4
MAEPAKVIRFEKIERSSSSSKILLDRESHDLVVALMGPVGSGLPAIASQLREKLSAQNYEVHTIKISDFINQCIQNGTINIGSDAGSNRYFKYQTAGNNLRKAYKTEVLAEYAINKIGRIRLASSHEDDFGEGRKAFIIDQLKHPDEIRLLRLVYRQNLY